eukprot:TRINITY_DN516_c1_g2_i1.p1 TRINITY_DN516_c1_g2~~TRINITY_DN516_c1_g2_i1.p1  ORF type:complete len:229 (-),score=34.89 TRINITY_DN516_c1_g2_i1:215-901(-)
MSTEQDETVDATPRRSLGLSATAEQRWRQLTEGRHLIPGVPGLREEDVQNNALNRLQPAPTLAQAMGLADRRRPMYEEDEDEVAPDSSAHILREAVVVNGDRDQYSQTIGGTAVSAARPTQQLLDEMTRDPGAPPLPASLRRLAAAGPFVPPEGEEWHVINGWHVRISRAELDQLLAEAEASESGEEDVDSQADTVYGPGSDRDREEVESVQGSEKSSEETSGERNAF